MGRPLRPQVEDGIYHVTSRGNRRSTVFFDDDDRRVFLSFLQHVLDRDRLLLISYCLMTTHYHLLVRTPRANISQGMHRLNTRYATWFNDRHTQVGHVFQARFHSVLVETEAQLLRVYRYVALNPVRAGICAAPVDWYWSSYAAIRRGPTTSPRVDRSTLIKLFGHPRGLQVAVEDA
jgi:putative transposase